MVEGPRHLNAKTRLYNLVLDTEPRPDLIETERIYPNPKNLTGDKKWDWKFDVYFEVIDPFNSVSEPPAFRKVALEVDGQNKDGEVGHNSKKSKEKRDFKLEYLKSKGIELYAWPRRWIIGRKALPDEDFLSELKLVKSNKEWFDK